MRHILAIDLGKNKSVYCDYDPQGGDHEFGTVPTGPKDFHDLLVRLAGRLVVIEISPLAGWVSDLCRALGVELRVVNTTSEQWSWKKVKNKSDREDGLKIARMEAMGLHRYVHVPRPPVRRWRELIACRDGQVRRATSSKNRIRAILDRQGERWPAGKKGWTAAAMAELEKEARPLEECGEAELSGAELWRGMLHVELASLGHTLERVEELEKRLDAMAQASPRVRRLTTTPGVGNRTAEVVIAMLDDSARFKNVSQVGSYTGLTPRRLQSGGMDRQMGISHAGSRLLRKMLVQASWVGRQTNPWMKATFDRVCGGKKERKKQAIVAVARQLFVRLWAMDRDGKDWNGPAAVTPAWRSGRREAGAGSTAAAAAPRTRKASGGNGSGAPPPNPRDLSPATPPPVRGKRSGPSVGARPARRMAAHDGAPVASQQSRTLRVDKTSLPGEE